MADRPLGPILHIINDEAIVQPHQAFVANGAKVVTASNKVIGKLSYPIGRVDRPYQVIKLTKVDRDLVGEFVVAKISKKKRKR